MGEYRRLTKSLRPVWLAVFAFSSRSLQQVTTFVLTLLAARVLVPAEYGIYTLSVLFVTFLQTLLFSGVFHYAIRTAASSEDENSLTDTCFWMITILAVAGSAALFFSAPYIARLFDAPEIEWVLQLLSIVQPLFGYTAWSSAILMRKKRMTLHFKIMFAQNIFAFSAGVVLLYIWPSILALVLYRVIRATSGCILYLVFGKLWPGLKMNWSIAWKALKFSFPIYGTRILNFFSNYGADLVLGVMFTTAEAGLYRFGNRLAMGAADIVAHPMRSFALTQFGAANREKRDVGPIVDQFTSTTLVLVGCAVASVLVFGEGLVREFFRPEYLGALVVIYAISVRAIFGLGNFFVEPVLASTGQTKVALAHHGVWAVVQVLATLAVAAFGINILAWTVAGVALVSGCAGYWVISRFANVPLRPIGRSVLRSTAFVLLYYVLALAAQKFFVLEFGAGVEALILGIVMSTIFGVLTLIWATKMRVFDLRTFSG